MPIYIPANLSQSSHLLYLLTLLAFLFPESTTRLYYVG
ncbi:hypothetical protein F383_25774 [Gossypium arboreum]|uniref:Uncharacterized protein n=1 Tax=Gossypium arboreum TaxID=29729 RepID=A0A0B0P179_GOSAR|nr:hypothetical protein F383_25774 [Gossypium arboreum]